MRGVLLVLCVVLCASAASAEKPICQNLDGQMLHYQTLRGRADAFNSALWEQRLDAHLKRLKQQRKLAGCPDKSGLDEAAKQLKALLQLAAQGALTFFTFGAM
jgi:hypothetical protein